MGHDAAAHLVGARLRVRAMVSVAMLTNLLAHHVRLDDGLRRVGDAGHAARLVRGRAMRRASRCAGAIPSGMKALTPTYDSCASKRYGGELVSE
eukprot:scaffold34289_cov52-Phaeocystis_antarctica.AAC.1